MGRDTTIINKFRQKLLDICKFSRRGISSGLKKSLIY